MKLFVWRNVLYDYEAGIIFAVADSVEEAREMVADKVRDIDRSIKPGKKYLPRDIPCLREEAAREKRILLEDIIGEPDVIEGKWVEWLWGGS